MKIASSNVALVSQSSYNESTTKVESLNSWITKGDTTTKINQSNAVLDTFNISEQAKSLQLNSTNYGIATDATQQGDSISQLPSKDQQMITLLQKLIEALSGKKIKFVIPKNELISDPNVAINIQSFNTGRASNGQQTQSAGWGLRYDQSTTHYESESTSFNAQAAVTTQDGREINVDLQLNLSREFMSQSSFSFSAGDAKRQIDPLVINYNAPTASVTDKKYQFDIDADGTTDQISFVGQGSGFLALDLNNDGTINDGKELFGPESGNGFSDLANYDTDNNNWIDENDAIYDKLRIWSKDSEGNNTLFALGEKGIGAIYLGNVSTSFALKDSNNQSNAQLQRSGIYLNENGTAGTIQHIDLMV